MSGICRDRRLNDEIKAFMSKIGFKSIESLPPSVLKVYDTCDIVKKTIDARLEKTRIICHWYIDLNENSLKVFTPDRESLFDFIALINCNLYSVDITKCFPNIRFQFAITVYKFFAHSKSLFCDRSLNRFQCSVSIEVTTNLVYQQQLGQWVNLDKGLHLILVHGHMSEMAYCIG
jgi:hypothetical protein